MDDPAPTAWSAPLTDLPVGRSLKFPLRWRGRPVEAFVVNVEGHLHAYVNRCTHAGAPLDWWPNEFFTDDGRFLVCGTHGALFEPATGRCAGGPCGNSSLYALAVRIEEDRVVVEDPDVAPPHPGGVRPDPPSSP